MQWHLQLLTPWLCSPGDSLTKSGPMAITASEIGAAGKALPHDRSPKALAVSCIIICSLMRMGSDENLGLHVF